jgi:hypothetical protein
MQKNSKLDISMAGLKKRKGAPVRTDLARGYVYTDR